MKRKNLLVLFLVAVLVLVPGCGKAATEKAQGIGLHHAEITVENYGVLKVELYGDEAPITVQNFMDLANSGFYDGLTFMRVHKNFVLQGGDPEKTGRGGSENKITGEFSSNGIENNLTHTKGTLSMARSTDKNSASSQFFIMLVDYSGLDGDYAAFGRVTEGLELLDLIEKDFVGFANPARNYFIDDIEKQPVIKTVVITD